MLSFVKLHSCVPNIKAFLRFLFCPHIFIQLIIFSGLCIKSLIRFLNGHLFTVFWTVLTLCKSFDGFLHLLSTASYIFTGSCFLLLTFAQKCFQNMNMFLRNMLKYRHQKSIGQKRENYCKIACLEQKPFGCCFPYGCRERGRGADWSTCT